MQKLMLAMVVTVLLLNSCCEDRVEYVQTPSASLYVHSYDKEVFKPFTLNYEVK